MKIYRGLHDPRLKKSVRSVAIGMFDGVHRGHAAILKKAARHARRVHGRSFVVTFDPHPQKILFPQKGSPRQLMSLEHRLRHISALGVDEALVIPFNKKFASMTHQRFLKQLLALGMRSISVGHDFCFGKRAAGNREYLRRMSSSNDFILFVSQPLKKNGRVISSTGIRLFIEKGDFLRASQMLGRPVSIVGSVVHGKGRGRKMGFPTANLDPHHETLPPPGVYAATGVIQAHRENGTAKPMRCVVHIGPRPTFGDKDRSVEAFFPGFRGDLYGREIELFFTKKLRPVRRFRDQASLTRQIQKDLRRAGFSSLQAYF